MRRPGGRAHRARRQDTLSVIFKILASFTTLFRCKITSRLIDARVLLAIIQTQTLILQTLIFTNLQTLIIYKLGVNQNYYTFTLILLIKIVLCSEFPRTNFIDDKCFDMKLRIRIVRRHLSGTTPKKTKHQITSRGAAGGSTESWGVGSGVKVVV